MSKKYIETKQLLDFLGKNQAVTHQEICDFIELNTIEVYLGRDKSSIAKALYDIDRGDEFESLSEEQKTEILELFSGWVADNNFSDLEDSLIEAIDCIKY